MAQPQPPAILPFEIITEILYRLPPKPLLRFKTVSKSWLSLIFDPNFIKQHLHQSAANSLKIIAAASSGQHYDFFPIKSLLCDVINMHDDDDDDDAEYEEIKFDCSNSRIVGSCDGLICITTGKNELFVWNPAMRMSRKLPNCEIIEVLGIFRSRALIYGFGYDEVNNDYKVVMMISAVGIGNDCCRIEVYSMKSNCWKRIEDFPYGPHHENGLSVHGALVWPAVSTSPATVRSVVHGVPVINIEWKIVALDLGSESYIDVPQPDRVHALRDKLLGVMDGCLCIFAHFRGTRLEVWMMKEFGVRESWSKVATVPYLVKPCWSDELPLYKPLWCSKDGEMIILFRSKLIVYNLRDCTFKHPPLRKVSMLASIYIESLVSPLCVM